MPFNLQVSDQVPALTLRGAENLGRGIEQFGAGIGRLLEGLAAKKEQAKLDAKKNKALIALGEAMGLDKDVMSTRSVEENEAMVQGVHFKLGLEELRQRNRKFQREEQQAAAAPGFFASLAAMEGGGPSVGELQRFYEEGDGTTPRPAGRQRSPFAMIAQAQAESGYTPDQGAFADIVRMMERSRSGGAVPGTVRPVEGMPGFVFGIQSESGGGTFLPVGTGKIPMKDAPKIEGYDLVPTDDGGWRYQRKANAKPTFDLTAFDANGDGKLTGAEVNQAMLAAAMAKEGLPYEGMPVTRPAAPGAAPAAGGNLYDQFQNWRKAK